MQMAWLSAQRGDFSDLHGRFQHLSLSAHVPICHFNRAGKKLPLHSLAQVPAVKSSQAKAYRGGRRPERVASDGGGVRRSHSRREVGIPKPGCPGHRLLGDCRRAYTCNPTQQKCKETSFNFLKRSRTQVGRSMRGGATYRREEHLQPDLENSTSGVRNRRTAPPPSPRCSP